MKTPYLQSQRHKISKWIFWIIIAMVVLCLFGCAKTKPASETIADSAQQSLNAIGSTLPKDCMTPAIEKQLNATETAIKAMVTACNSEKETINQEKLRWEWAFIALALIVAVHIGRKVMK